MLEFVLHPALILLTLLIVSAGLVLNFISADKFLPAFLEFAQRCQNSDSQIISIVGRKFVEPVRIYYELHTIFSLGIIIAIWISCLVLLFISITATVLIDASNPYLVPVFLLSGFLLYGLRSRKPFLYGSIELAVGLSSICYSCFLLSQAASNTARLFAISSGVYIVVRGLDNMNKEVPKPLRKAWKHLRWYS